ncbi:MAG: hypothetical protein U1E73_09980 [Planctomycetota bacterium]
MNWLHAFLERRLREVFCGRIQCTTCGGITLWLSLQDAAQAECRRRGLDAADLGPVILSGLRELRPARGDEEQWGAATVAVLLRLRPKWRASDFAGTWVGDLLAERRKIDAEAALKRQRRAEYESPKAVEARREEDRRRRQEAHAETPCPRDRGKVPLAEGVVGRTLDVR